MRRSKPSLRHPLVQKYGGNKEIEWELRPGGMLVQKRDDGSGFSGPVIKLKVSHGIYQHEVTVPAQSTFGELKRVLVQETGLEPHEQRLLFRGKEKDDDECLHMVGVKEFSKVILLEDPASKERKLEEMKRNTAISKACEAIAGVRAEIEKLAVKVSALDQTVQRCTKIAEKELVVLTEMLMLQLLKLDGIEAEGEAKVQRRAEVRRVQNLVEMLDVLKAKNSNPFSNSSSSVSMTTEWETFDSGLGSLSAPPLKPPAKVTHDWEVFD